ncbi:MAG: ABC transporter permease subunit [Planctomycetota bacterium]|jgi:ABC-type transport system involved in multi-copper enzyme maturation permease subunit
MAALLIRMPGPVFWNEMRGLFLRDRPSGWVLGGVSAVCAAAFCLGVHGWFGSLTFEGDPPGRKIFLLISVVALGFIIVASPVYSAGAFIRERDRRTFDMLVSAGLSRFELILGKMFSAFARTFAGVLATLPAAVAAQALGGVSGAELAYHLLFFSSLAAVSISLGVTQSMLLRSFALSLMVTYLLVAYIIVASVFVTLVAYGFHMAIGVPYAGFWAISTVINFGMAFLFTSGSLILFGRLTKWDY